MSYQPSFRFFTSFPPELQLKIVRFLGITTILRLTAVSKGLRALITDSEALLCEIDAFRADLYQLRSSQHYSSSVLRQALLPLHFDATRHVGTSLRITGPERPLCVIRAQSKGCRCERLFRGYLAVITEDSCLYVWDVRTPPVGCSSSSTPARNLPSEDPIIKIEGMEIQDVILAPEADLIVLLCFTDESSAALRESDEERPTTSQAIIKLLQWSSFGTRPYPHCRFSELVHDVLGDDTIAIYPGQQFLSLQNELLAFHFFRDYDYRVRRGIIWDFPSGQVVYDTQKTAHPEGFRHLLLLSDYSFAVSTSTPLDQYDHSGAIELYVVTADDMRPRLNRMGAEVICVFQLPPLDKKEQSYLSHGDFYTNESTPINPASGTVRLSSDVSDFPFASLPDAGVHVMLLQYEEKQRVGSNERFYLVIPSRVFHEQVLRWTTRRHDASRRAIVLDWIQWGLVNTYMTGYSTFSELSMTSSVCGSRICHVRTAEDDSGNIIARIIIDDFNRNLSCESRGCPGSMAHFEHHPVLHATRSNTWQSPVTTWLPFHRTTSKHFELPDELGQAELVMPFALMAEDKIILCIRPDGDEHTFTRKWWILPLLRGTQDPVNSGTYLVETTPSMEWTPLTADTDFRSDLVCRICQSMPLSDAHVLFECEADTRLITLRQRWKRMISHYHVEVIDLVNDRQINKALEVALRRRNGVMRPSLSILAADMKSIYFGYPPNDERRCERHPTVQIFRE